MRALLSVYDKRGLLDLARGLSDLGWELVASGQTAVALGIAPDGVQGMSLPVLRETRMPAVICEVGPPARVVARAGPLARAIVEALTIWAVTPVE